MGWFSTLFNSGKTKSPVEAITDLVDEVWDSEEELMTAERLKTALAMKPSLAQAKINEVQVQHRSTFVAGARPFLMWVCGFGLGFAFIINPILQWSIGIPGPELPMEDMNNLVLGMLGLGALRTYEKTTGVSK